jgi:formylglycine-generating enzyme required for sulfatase activity
MHEVSPGVGLVKQQDVKRKLEEIYTARGEANPEAAARQFLVDVREYAALLLERGTEEYGFIHLTFEEYLAAVALAFLAQGEAQPIVEILATHIGEQAWREVSLLTVAYIGIRQNLPRVAGQVVEALAKSEIGEAGEAALLAGEATLDALPDGVMPESRAKVTEALIPAMQNEKAKPETRHRAGLTLSRLGWVPQDLDGLVEIPSGIFLYGYKKEEKAIPYKYWIAKYPVTNLQFARFLKAGGYENEAWWSQDGWAWRTRKYATKARWIKKEIISQSSGETHNKPYYWDSPPYNNVLQPVVGVTWFEAQAYCNWMNEQPLEISKPEGYITRLPNELEWERAARFTDGREYPWGENFETKFANTRESGLGTSIVCTYALSKSHEGVWDMSGNVWEWSADWYEKGKYRSLRGGSWFDVNRLARCINRDRDLPDYYYEYVGFRVVVSLAISEY